MDILSYLSELIQTRSAVGIAGLGTIFKTKIPGRYDAATHSFIPPGYQLNFTSELKEEILFAEYISKNRNISIDTAKYFISDFSERTQKQLDDQEQVPFGTLGILSRVNGELKFDPAKEVNYGFDFFGLPPVKAIEELPTAQQPDEQQPDEQQPEALPTLEEGDAAIANPETAEEPIAIQELSTVGTPTDQVKDDKVPADQVKANQVQADEVSADQVQKEGILPVSAEQTEANQAPGDQVQNEEITPVPAATENASDQPAEDLNETPDEENAPLSPAEEPILKSIITEPKSPYVKATGREIEEMVWKANENRNKETTGAAAPVAGVTAEQVAVPAAAPTTPSPITPVPYPPVVPPHVFPSQGQPFEELPEEETRSTPLYLKVIIAVAILAALAAAAFYLKPELFNGQGVNTPKQQMPVNQQKSTIPAIDTAIVIDTASTADSLSQSKADTAVAAKNTTAVATNNSQITNPADTATVYEIIGASMLNQKEADNFIKQMQRSGVKAKVVTNMAGKRLKMSIATLKDEASAKEEQKRLYEKLKIEGTYIYRNKQK